MLGLVSAYEEKQPVSERSTSVERSTLMLFGHIKSMSCQISGDLNDDAV